MDGGNSPTTLLCTLLAIDHSNICYRVCAICERSLPENLPSRCQFCDLNAFNPGSSGSKRLFRLLMSVASDKRVFTVICFDTAARALFGCSADQFFDFAKLHPFAAHTAAKVLEGEMLRLTLCKPKNGNARNARAVSVVPLRTGFQPAIETLRELYGPRTLKT